MPRKWRGNEGKEHRNWDGGCIKSDLEWVGEEWNIL